MTRRALAVLSGLALALAALVIVDRPAPAADPGTESRVVPGFRPARVVRLVLAAPGRPDVVLERAPVAGSIGLVLTAPGRFLTDQAAARDLLAALEYLAWRRRLPAEASRAAARGLDAPRIRITFTEESGISDTILVGATDANLGRTWIGRPGGRDVYLVDAYAARALDRTADDLRRREPFRFLPDDVARLAVDAVVLRGHARCVEISGGCAAVDRVRLGQLLDRLAELRLTRFLPSAPGPEATPVLRVDAGEESLTLFGPCPGAPDEARVVSAVGDGCIAGDAAAALAALPRDAAAWVAHAPFSFPVPAVTGIELRPAGAASAVVLQREGGIWSSVAPDGARNRLDEESVRAWLNELASFRAQALVPAPVNAGAGDEIVLHAEKDRHERLRLIRAGATLLVRRNDEPVALVFHPALARYVQLDTVQLEDRLVLWFEPYSLSAIERDGGERAERGATTADWRLTRPVAGPADGDIIQQMRDAAADLRAKRVERRAPPAGEWRRLTFFVDPPPGTTGLTVSTREIEVMPLADSGTCVARRTASGPLYTLSSADCSALAPHLASRQVHTVRADDVTALAVGPERWERHGPTWFAADGQPLDPARSAAVGELATGLARAPVEGYGDLTGPTTPVVIEAGSDRIELLVAGGVYQRVKVPIRHRVPSSVCRDFPRLCVR